MPRTTKWHRAENTWLTIARHLNIGSLIQCGAPARLKRGWAKYGWRLGSLLWMRGAEFVERQRVMTRRGKLWLFCRADIGAGTVIEQGCFFSPGAWLTVGERVHIGRNSSFYIGESGQVSPEPVRIGDRTWISEGFLLASMSGVKIGRNVLIGEHVSVRDTTHACHDRTRMIRDQGDVYGTVVIEDDVWVGRGCLIQGTPDGVTIGQGAILGANSVVTRSVPPMQVWGGVPARFIKER